MRGNKGFLGFLMVLVLSVSMVLGASPVLANNGITVEVDGQRVIFADQEPVIVDGRTLVPVRGVFETLGYEIGWEGSTQTVTLSNVAYTVIIRVGSQTFTTNGISYTLDVPAQIINGRTMLPLRAVLESVGCALEWDGANQRVIVSSSGATVPTLTINPTSIRLTARNGLGSSVTVDVGGTAKGEIALLENTNPDWVIVTPNHVANTISVTISTDYTSYPFLNGDEIGGQGFVQIGREGQTAILDINISVPAATSASSMVYYNDFPTVPDFAWVVRDYHNITSNNVRFEKGDNGYADSYSYDLYRNDNREFLASEFSYTANPWSSQGSPYDADKVRTFLSNYEILYNAYIQTLLSEGFVKAGFHKNVGSGAGYALSESFQKGNISVLVKYDYGIHGEVFANLSIWIDVIGATSSTPTPQPTPVPTPEAPSIDSRFVGVWVSSSGITYTFNPNGTYVIMDDDGTSYYREDGNFSSNAATLTLSITMAAGIGSWYDYARNMVTRIAENGPVRQDYPYYFADGRLFLTNPNGSIIQLSRK